MASGRSVPKHGCFLEGPAFDRAGNLYVTDIPFGRIFRVDARGSFTLVAEYDGEPNGLAIDADGRILVADYRQGLLELDPTRGTVKVIVDGYRAERFKGINDLTFADNGDLYFTDQGQTALDDPTGRIYRLRANGVLDRLADNLPSPNGLVLNGAQGILYVAVTRANAVWRLPLLAATAQNPAGGVARRRSARARGPRIVRQLDRDAHDPRADGQLHPGVARHRTAAAEQRGDDAAEHHPRVLDLADGGHAGTIPGGQALRSEPLQGGSPPGHQRELLERDGVVPVAR
jgi:sugar lactone lactonase YvrE